MLSGLGTLGDHAAAADMIVVPTWPVDTHPIPDELIEQLNVAHSNGARIVGLCLGAFAVAEAGLLDGASAVTHWHYRSKFEAAFPSVTFEPDTLYVDLDSVVTSAGSAAALDCCLHLLRTDHGAETAATVARSLVTAPHRGGTQSQFASAPPIQPGPDPFSAALALAASDIGAIAVVDDLAGLANCSRRSFERQLRSRLGISPKQWITEQRVIAACRLLETSDLSIEQIAGQTGFGSTPTLRRAFLAARGTTPSSYREMFRA